MLKRTIQIALWSAFLLTALACRSAEETQTNESRLLTGEFKWGVSNDAVLHYLYYLPPAYQNAGTNHCPLMLFLHGAGERSQDLSRVAVHGPLKLVKQGRDFPFIIVAPLCDNNEHWDNAPLLALVDHVTKTFPVDEDRIYATGLSMGGYGTWNLGLAYPERFAAIAPMCGGGQMIDSIVTRNDKPEAFLSLPVWAFHCQGDPTVPIAESTRMVDALKKLGCTDIKLTIYPRNEHDCWTEAYQNPELYSWLLSHTRHHPAK
jgi:predicted peptidase